MKFAPDLSDYKDTFGGYIPPGRYTVVIEDVTGDKSKAGDTQAVLTLRVRGGEFDGQTVIDRLTDVKTAHFRIKNFVEALTGKPFKPSKLNMETDQWLGRAIGIDTSERTWTDSNNKERTSVNIDGYISMKNMKAVAETESSSEADDLDTTDTSSGLDEFKPKSNGQVEMEQPALDDEMDLASIDL